MVSRFLLGGFRLATVCLQAKCKQDDSENHAIIKLFYIQNPAGDGKYIPHGEVFFRILFKAGQCSVRPPMHQKGFLPGCSTGTNRHPLCCVSPGRDAPAAGAESEERAALRKLAFLHAPPACASFSCRFSNCAQPMPASPFRVRKDAKSEGQLQSIG